jgi:hypothetical protein
MTRGAELLSDDSLPQATIDDVQRWVDEATEAVQSQVGPFNNRIYDATAVDRIYREHFSKLRGDALVQHCRAVFRCLLAGRRELQPIRPTLYVGGKRQPNPNADALFARDKVLEWFADALLSRKLPVTEALVDDALRVATETHVDYRFSERAVKLAATYAESNALSTLSREMLAKQRDYWKTASGAVFAHSIDQLIADEPTPPIQPGDAWTDTALAEMDSLDAASRQNWYQLLMHASTVNASKPNQKWRQSAAKHVENIGRVQFQSLAAGWLRLIGEPGQFARKVAWWGDKTDVTRLDELNIPVAIGLVWILAAEEGDASALGHVARAAFKRIAQGQLRCEPLGNAAVRALASIAGEDGVAQLAQLEVMIRAPKPRRLIQKMLKESADREGVALVDIEETAIADFGLRDGRIRREFGDYLVEIVPDGDFARIAWLAPDGARLRAIPKPVKQQHPGAQDEIKQLAKQLEAVLPAQRARIERLMKSTRRWPVRRWRDRYLNHPLVSLMARRLIWMVSDRAVMAVDGVPRDIDGNEVAVDDREEVRLWHPIGREPAEVVAWRERIESLQISQPFKQAHREVYILTDAERNTDTYSNRFAAHILKNTAMVALCQTRGWVTGLFGGQTGPRLDMPDFGVRAEFWVEPAGDDYTDFGAPIYVATDQVRFYALTLPDAERLGHAGGLVDPLPLHLVPPHALTEAMRDVDLFIGLASVGNDPNWSDGGPNGRYRDYWHNYSFGELTESAKTRREVLQRVIPRLEIADRCQLTDKFLRVAGRVRAYKIHLGSGNILMEPNDQYLCIVPDRRADELGNRVFLPFDGDRTLSIIISKALLLADDAKITDPTIVNQIRCR